MAIKIKFPNDVDTHDQFMHFVISKKYVFKREQIEEKEKYATITLPLPTALNTSYAATYSNQGLNLIGNGLAQNAENNIEQTKVAFDQIKKGNKDGAINALKNMKIGIKGGTTSEKATEMAKYFAQEAVTGGAALVGSAAGGLGAAFVGVVASGIVKGTQVGLGTARNPYLAATFDGVNFKNHSFQFQLTPKSIRESDSIRAIISLFRNAMLPSKGTVTGYYDYPNQIDIAFYKDEYLFDIKTSYLTQFDVNYHGKGAFYHDINGKKAPVEVTISMTFLESIVRLSDDEKHSIRGTIPPGSRPVDNGSPNVGGLGTTSLDT
jgi:hypothetical protein